MNCPRCQSLMLLKNDLIEGKYPKCPMCSYPDRRENMPIGFRENGQGIKRLCVRCNGEFTDNTVKHNQMYCSECAIEMRRIRSREWWRARKGG